MSMISALAVLSSATSQQAYAHDITNAILTACSANCADYAAATTAAASYQNGT